MALQTLDDHITRVRSFGDARRANRKPTMTCWSGLTTYEPSRSEAEIVAAGTAAYEAAQRAAAQPRNLLFGALSDIQLLGKPDWTMAAEQVREANSRGFMKADGSPNVDAIARAIKLLNPIPGMAAVEAREILADMLVIKLDGAA